MSISFRFAFFTIAALVGAFDAQLSARASDDFTLARQCSLELISFTDKEGLASALDLIEADTKKAFRGLSQEVLYQAIQERIDAWHRLDHHCLPGLDPKSTIRSVTGLLWDFRRQSSGYPKILNYYRSLLTTFQGSRHLMLMEGSEALRNRSQVIERYISSMQESLLISELLNRMGYSHE